MIEPKTLLRDARKRLKMTQAAMADHLHIKQATVSLYEGGKVEPSVEILMRLERLVESEPDLRSALVQQVNNRIRSMTPQQVDEDLPIYITDVAPPFSEFVRDLIARLKTISAPPGLIKMLRLYLRTNNAAEMWPLFAKAAD